jgi:hypothetical protein
MVKVYRRLRRLGWVAFAFAIYTLCGWSITVAMTGGLR